VWLIFGVVFGGLPLIADGVVEAFSANGFSSNLLLIEGGLFIVSAVMAAGAIGELFVADLLCVGNTAAYIASATPVSCLTAEQRTVDSPLKQIAELATLQQQACMSSASFLHPTLAFHLSLWFFVATALASAACIGMAAGR
jgi:hypothetical protein